jgi:hypothetical protein
MVPLTAGSMISANYVSDVCPLDGAWATTIWTVPAPVNRGGRVFYRIHAFDGFIECTFLRIVSGLLDLNNMRPGLLE